ncbi:MAG: ABC transporter ATP-binding protein [Oligoflexales bacterium]|nr:ABC transporter ATP-binding protein [Oligoflexales bacterium]
MQSHFLKPYLKLYAPSLLGAHIASIGLALVTATFGILIGPLVQVIANGKKAQSYNLQELVGSFYGKLLNSLYSLESVSYQTIMDNLPLLVCSIAALRLIFQVSQWYMFEEIGERISKDIRSRIISSYLKLSAFTQNQKIFGEQIDAQLTSACTNDIKVMREYFVHYYGGLPREILQIIFLTANLLILDASLFMIFLFGITPVLLILRKYGKKLSSRYSKALDVFAELTEWLQQRLSGVVTIKHYHTEDYETKKMDELSQNLYQRFINTNSVRAKIAPLIETFSTIAIAIVLYIALNNVSAQKYEGAIILNFFASLGFLSQSGGKLARYFNSNKEGEAALERLQNLNSFLEDNSSPTTVDVANSAASKNLDNSQVLIECSEISYKYLDAKAPAIHNFNFTFKPGKFYCIYGQTGSGKSTLFNLLMRQLKPDNGHIIYTEAANDFCYVPQKIIVAPQSLADNISYPFLNGNTSNILAALEKVGLEHLSSDLEFGLDTILGSQGRSLSGGQAQRLFLARLFYLQKNLNFIDEGTSAIDPELELKIFLHLKDFVRSGKSIIMIAHRPLAAEFADTLLLLENGQLAFSGTPEEMKKKSAFNLLTNT